MGIQLLTRSKADIFGSGDNSNDVASRWYQKYRADNESAVTDLVNCVLLAASCDEQVTEDDIRDPDNIQNRLSELQDLYQEVRLILDGCQLERG